ncbi:MAG: hypothetical protein Q4G30_02640 [Actinomycetaceae bacterium]|nr:hypothetical protein [Actinomycetaceae bacterium]
MKDLLRIVDIHCGTWCCSSKAALSALGITCDENEDRIVYVNLTNQPDTIRALRSYQGDADAWVLPLTPEIQSAGRVLNFSQRYVSVGRAVVDTLCTGDNDPAMTYLERIDR